MGDRQHFLPAAFLGGFSEEGCSRARERVLWVARRSGEVYREKAENVAFRRDLYTHEGSLALDSDPRSVDHHLSAPEQRLPHAIAELGSRRGGRLPATTWQVLIAFIASLFVRGPEFGDRFESRLGPQITEIFPPDNTTMARVIELQRLFAPVMYANWRPVLMPSGRVVCNDVGYFPTVDLVLGRPGYAVPLRKDLVVGLFAGDPGHVLEWDSTRWIVDMPDTHMADAGLEGMNRCVASNALDEIYGPTKEAVEDAWRGFEDERPPHGFGPGLLVPSSQALRDHDFDYMRFISAIAERPRDATTGWRMRWPRSTNWSMYEGLLTALAC